MGQLRHRGDHQLEFGGQRVESVGSPRHQDQIVTVRGEVTGEGGTDPGGGAGDEGGTAGLIRRPNPSER